jgi:hypothetical protein
VIEAGIKEGEFRPVQAESVARALSAAVIGMVVGRQRLLRHCQAPLPGAGTVVQEFLELVERGLAKEAS